MRFREALIIYRKKQLKIKGCCFFKMENPLLTSTVLDLGATFRLSSTFRSDA